MYFMTEMGQDESTNMIRKEELTLEYINNSYNKK